MDYGKRTQGVGVVTSRRSAAQVRALQERVACSIVGTHETEVEDKVALAEVLATLGLITMEHWRKIYANAVNRGEIIEW